MPTIVRAYVGYKPERRSSSTRRVESSDEFEKSLFVSQWGGSVLSQTQLPEAMQVALQEVARLEAEKAKEGNNARR